MLSSSSKELGVKIKKTFLEKRVHARKTVKFPVQYQAVDNPKDLEHLRGKIALAKDLSLDGIFIKTDKDKSLKPGDILRLDISMPEKSARLFTFAEVAWVSSKGAGLHLMQMAMEDHESLESFLQAK